MAQWNSFALKILMFMIGILLVIGSGMGFIGGSFFPFDKYLGVTGSMAGVAFGAGVMIAGFNPEANVSWVRAVILYCILEVIYEIFSQVSIGRFDVISFAVAIIVGVLILVLYPNKGALFMSGSAKGARA